MLVSKSLPLMSSSSYLFVSISTLSQHKSLSLSLSIYIYISTSILIYAYISICLYTYFSIIYVDHACVCVLSHCSSVQLFVASWTIACQAPLSIGFSRQEHWSGLPCPSPGDLLDPVIEPVSLTSPELAGRFFTTSATWEAQIMHRLFL